VRVGPFDSKAEADAAVKKIHELGLDAVVIQL
jgi:cell division protein FtsN